MNIQYSQPQLWIIAIGCYLVLNTAVTKDFYNNLKKAMKEKFMYLICRIYGILFPSKKYLMVREGNMYRVYAVRNFSSVCTGQKGGLICHKSILPHNDKSWLCLNSRMYNSRMENSFMYNSRMENSSMENSGMKKMRIENTLLNSSNKINVFFACNYFVTVTSNEKNVVAGCWSGTFEEFKVAKAEKYGSNPEYQFLIETIERWLAANSKTD